MRALLLMLLVVMLATAGCGGRKAAQSKATAAAGSAQTDSKLIVTPETQLLGKVVKFDADGQFVVLNFPVGHLPAMGQRLSIYRFGLKVGDLKVTGPQMDDNIVGDVIAGEAKKGDEVREH